MTISIKVSIILFDAVFATDGDESNSIVATASLDTSGASNIAIDFWFTESSILDTSQLDKHLVTPFDRLKIKSFHKKMKIITFKMDPFIKYVE